MKKTELEYTIDTLKALVNIPSPSGFCHDIVNFVGEKVNELGYTFSKTMKGNLLIQVNNSFEESQGSLLITAHLDTLGGMVRSIKEDGKLRMTSVGGFMMQSVEGEYCTVHTREGKKITGTILNTMPSVHVYSEARTQERKEEAMEIRLDKDVSSKEEVIAIGIQVGDFISFDPRCVMTEDGYIKSRHLDDKAGVAVIFGMLDYLSKNKITPKKNIQIMLSTYEEVGHGSAYIPSDVDTVLAIDMGAMGEDLTCSEKDVSICVKDSSGPYDYHMVTELTKIAKKNELQYSLDVYPFYGSDASAALRGGHDIKAALIGPGIHASHTMERTHKDGLLNTLNLLIGYAVEA